MTDANKQQEEVSEQYTGKRLPLDSFRQLVLNDTARELRTLRFSFIRIVRHIELQILSISKKIM